MPTPVITDPGAPRVPTLDRGGRVTKILLVAGAFVGAAALVHFAVRGK